MKVLLTGASGFVGNYLCAALDAHEVVTLGRSQGNDIIHDFRAEIPDWAIERLQGVDCIVHCGAEVHGLRSLSNPELFVQSNVRGTFNLLQAARKLQPKSFLYVSSAEAVGSAPEGFLDEMATLRPSNPYAAAKASGEMLCNAWRTSWGVPTQIVRFMNVFGEGQKTGKFVPDVIKKMQAGEPITLHYDTKGRFSRRQWIHVSELVKVLVHLVEHGQAGEIYHVQGLEMSNVQMANDIGLALHEVWREKPVLQPASHDNRYAILDTKLQGIYDGVSKTLAHLRETVKWYKENPSLLL